MLVEEEGVVCAEGALGFFRGLFCLPLPYHPRPALINPEHPPQASPEEFTTKLGIDLRRIIQA